MTAPLTPTDHSQTDRRPLRLEGEQLLELTQSAFLHIFVQKKEWIDQKIVFLSSLPTVDAIEPHPPERSPTSQQELESWWTEHDRIEAEVDAYDMGDLARLKSFAKMASKRDLSERGPHTDLIEIALTTLFAVDKLLHLLRARRKRLTLLSCRLRWEVATNAAWDQHRKLLAELPLFLSRVRWAVPGGPVLASRSDHPCFDPTSLPFHGATTNGAAPTPQERTVHSELLSLSLASLAAQFRALSRSALPASVLLDKLIDASPSPLPDSFLDAYEALEDSLATLEGLPEFLGQLVTQWRKADQVFWTAEGVSNAATALARDVAEEVLKLPSQAIATAFENRVTQLKLSLDSLASTRELLNPEHPRSVPDQPDQNRSLALTLTTAVSRAELVVQNSERDVIGYRFAAEALERMRVVRRELEEGLRTLRALVEDEAALDDRPDLQTVACLKSSKCEAFDARFDALVAPVGRILASSDSLSRRAAGVVVDIHRAGIDPNLRRELKDMIEGFRVVVFEVKGIIGAREEMRAALRAARSVDEAVATTKAELDHGAKLVDGEMAAASWPRPCPNAIPLDDSILSLRIKARINSLASLLDVATPLLLPTYNALHSHLDSKIKGLNAEHDAFHRSLATLSSLRQQENATTAFLAAISTLEKEAEHLLSDLEICLTSTPPKDDELAREAERTQAAARDLHARVSTVSSVALLRVPFVASGASENLEHQDQKVREAVNAALACLAGKVDEAESKASLLARWAESCRWDADSKTALAQLDKVEGDLKTAEITFAAGLDASAETLSAMRHKATNCSVAIQLSHATFASLSTSLEALYLTPESASPLFNSHATRRTLLCSVAQRHTDASASVAMLISAIQKVEDERRMKDAAHTVLFSKATAVVTQLESRAKQLNDLVRGLEALAGCPDLRDERCLTIEDDEASFDVTRHAIVEEITSAQADIPDLALKVRTTITELDAAEQDSTVAVSLAAAWSMLKAAVDAASARLEEERRSFTRLGAARRLHAALDDGAADVEGVKSVLLVEFDAGLHQESTSNVDLDGILIDLRHRLDAQLAIPVATVAEMLQSDYPVLYNHLETRAATLHAGFLDVAALTAATNRLLQHASSEAALRNDIQQISKNLRGISGSIEAAFSSEFSATIQSELQERTAQLSASLAALTCTVDSRLPSVHPCNRDDSLEPLSSLSLILPSTSLSPISVDSSSHYSAARARVDLAFRDANEALADTHQHLASLAHLREAAEWDASYAELATEVAESIRGVQHFPTTDQAPLCEDAFLEFRREATRSQVDLARQFDRLTSLSSHLDALRTSWVASAPMFDLHTYRRQQLDVLLRQHTSATDLSSSLLAAVDIAAAARSAELAAKHAAEQEEERRIVDEAVRTERWRASLLDLNLRIRDAGSATSSLARLAEATETVLDASRNAASIRHARLLEADAAELAPPEYEHISNARSALTACETELSAMQCRGSSFFTELELLRTNPLALEGNFDTISASEALDSWQLQVDLIRPHLSRIAQSLVLAAEEASSWRLDCEQRLQLRSEAAEASRRAMEHVGQSELDQRAELAAEVAAADELTDKAAGSRMRQEGTATHASGTAPKAVLDGLRQPPRHSRVSDNSDADLADVFGSTLVSHPFPDVEEADEVELDSAVLVLKMALDDVEVSGWLEDHPFQQLPDFSDTQQLEHQLAVVSEHFDGLGSQHDDLSSLETGLEQNISTFTRTSALAEFQAKVDIADLALSDLLNSIDSATPGLEYSPPSAGSPTTEIFRPTVPLAEAIVAASNAVTVVRKHAVPLIDDGRVESQIERLETALSEMTQMVEELQNPRAASSLSSVSSSSGRTCPSLRLPPSRNRLTSRTRSSSSNTSFRTSTRTSHTVKGEERLSRPPHPTSSQPLAAWSTSSSSTSSRPPAQGHAPLPSTLSMPRLESTSGIVTPRSRSTLSSTTSTTPRPRVTSLVATLPKPFLFGTASKSSLSKSMSASQARTSPTLDRQFRASRHLSGGISGSASTDQTRDTLASSTPSIRSLRGSLDRSPPPSTAFSAMTPTRNRPYAASRFGSSPPSMKRREPAPKMTYKPNAKRKVDVEVGRIVNSFPVSVPIKPAENHCADESGMYWIGERSYFVRILRSRSCMVRIGGGWQEMSSFLHSHFANTIDLAAVTISPSSSLSSSLYKSAGSSAGERRWMSSASLAASTPGPVPMSIRSVSSSSVGHSPQRPSAPYFLSASVPASAGSAGATPKVTRKLPRWQG